MFISEITIEGFRCFGYEAERFEMKLKPGLTALVGENDAGKTAVVDALRFALGTTDQSWYHLEDTDFNSSEERREIKIVCHFEGLTGADKRAFVEYLSYGPNAGDDPILVLSWTAKDTGEQRKGRPYRRVEVHSGKDGTGPTVVNEARDLLRATYLRPLRDADHALTAGRGSRLAQVLRHSQPIMEGADKCDSEKPLEAQKLSLAGIADLLEHLLTTQAGVVKMRDEIDRLLSRITLQGEGLVSSINASRTGVSEEVRLKELLEKLDLRISGAAGVPGLGSNNLLFIACELLLLAADEAGAALLLIEEPEAHLHAQRQLRMMRYLQKQAHEERIQVIVTTHSPNLASAIDLENIIVICKHRAFPMSQEHTMLELSDYRFLQRFLDVTKANLFFARGVIIVEGDAENILLPTLAGLLERDFTHYGISVVNVGGVGLRRYGRIFQRKGLDGNDPETHLQVPVACLADMDVMPDCAPTILEKVKPGDSWPDVSKRRWRARRDFQNDKLEQHRRDIAGRVAGQSVKTFVSDHWTLEYDLALGPANGLGKFTGALAEDVFIAACLAAKDDSINAGKITASDVESEAVAEFAALNEKTGSVEGCAPEEVVASEVYARFAVDGVSKAVAAQYLAERLKDKHHNGNLSTDDLRRVLPTYLVDAIDYVTGNAVIAASRDSVDE